MIRLSFAVVVVVVLLGFANAAPLPKDAEPVPYMPTEVGAKWVYEFTITEPNTRATTKEVTVFVDKVEVDEEGASVVSLRLKMSGWPDNSAGQFKVSKDGLTEMSAFPGGAYYRPPIRVLQTPYHDGVSWTTKTMVIEQERTETRKAHGPERVAVPAGEFDAIRVESEYLFSREGPKRSTQWYAPRVGLVKWAVRNEMWTLKSFTPGKP